MAQAFKTQLAEMYMQNKDYKKAEEQYKELYKNNEDLYYIGYIRCLQELADFKQGEKVIKKQIKKYKNDPNLRLMLVDHYNKSNEKEKAQKEFEKIIKACPSDPQKVIELANILKENKQIDEAIKLYELKRKEPNIENYTYELELASLYQQKGDNESAINAYIGLLDTQPENLEQIKNALQTLMNDDKDGSLKNKLKSQLIKRSNNSPNNNIYTDLIIWYFIQDKDFEQAFNQAKAVDKRKNEEGQRLVYLAPICIKNNDYETATNCFNYLISKGKESYYYKYALQELAHTNYLKFIDNSNYTALDLSNLITNLNNTLEELGKNESTYPLIIDLATLYLNYADKANDAILLIDVIFKNTKINVQQEAQLKLLKADAYIIQGEMYEPVLLYGQVDKQFKEDPIGAEAKYRNAKLSFYKNDFEWSQAQLDVLKASTSKLIANDALYFSLLIQDNTIDSNYEPLSMFARADLLIFQHKYTQAFNTFDSIATQFPGHSLNDDILFRKGIISLQQQKYTDAINYFFEITKNYYNDILMDDALLKMAEIHQNKLKDNIKASALYEEIITKHTASIYVVEARKQYRILRGDKVNN